ncbi:MAG: tetratricopeptide repeat protein, partial [Myxococcota bacterium]
MDIDAAFGVFQHRNPDTQRIAAQIEAQRTIATGTPLSPARRRATEQRISGVIKLVRLEVFGKLGNIYSRLKKPKEALNFYKQSLAIFLQTNDEVRVLSLRLNMAICHTQIGNYEEALSIAKECQYKVNEQDNHYLKGWVFRIIGECYLSLNNFEEAIHSFGSQIRLANKLDDWQQKVEALTFLGKSHLALGQYHLVEKNVQEALNISIQRNLKAHQYACHELFSQLYKAQGDFEKSLHHYEHYHAIKELVFSQENEERFQQLESSHKIISAKKEAEIFRFKTQELERLVKERTIELKEVNLSLKRLIQKEIAEKQIKTHLITTIAHRFRIPLTVILNSTELLTKGLNKFSID